jgi:Na+-driven multidrug efflux pump
MGVLLMGFCRNDGSPRLVTAATIVSTAINIFLDWLFIFPLQKGVAGAAVATGISQTISLFIVLTHFIRRRGVLHLHVFTPNFALWRKIALRGLPEMVAQFSAPVTTFCMNYTLITSLGGRAVNGFAVINYVAAFSIMVFFGTSEGLQPLFSKSYGAKNEKDLKYYFRIGIFINLTASFIILVLLLISSRVVCGLFGADEPTTAVIMKAMPKFMWSFPIVSLNMIVSSYLYSTKRTREAIIINLCRGLLFNSVIISVFPVLFGTEIVWFTSGIAEALTLAAALALLKHAERGGLRFR